MLLNVIADFAVHRIHRLEATVLVKLKTWRLAAVMFLDGAIIRAVLIVISESFGGPEIFIRRAVCAVHAKISKRSLLGTLMLLI